MPKSYDIWIGRGVEAYDQPTLRAIMRESENAVTINLRDLVEEIVKEHAVSNEEVRGDHEFMSMTITKKHLARRAFLRGAGTTLALPFLDAMVPAFGASTAGPKPVDAHGLCLRPERDHFGGWLPATEGVGFEFNTSMKALEPFRDQVLVLSNLAQIQGRSFGDGGGDHARAGASWLTGVHPKKTEGADIHSGISADQVAARQLGKQDAIHFA
jgi:hypothetical protein